MFFFRDQGPFREELTSRKRLFYWIFKVNIIAPKDLSDPGLSRVKKTTCSLDILKEITDIGQLCKIVLAAWKLLISEKRVQ